MSAQSRRVVTGVLAGLAVLTGILFMVSSCSDMGSQVVQTLPPSGGPGPVSFANQIQPIFTNSCASRGCHPGGGAPFSLLAAVSYDNLVNVTATVPCPGVTIPRVKPFSPDSSALVRRLAGTCGLQMPVGFSPLSGSDQTLIRDWITQGALKN